MRLGMREQGRERERTGWWCTAQGGEDLGFYPEQGGQPGGLWAEEGPDAGAHGRPLVAAAGRTGAERAGAEGGAGWWSRWVPTGQAGQGAVAALGRPRVEPSALAEGRVLRPLWALRAHSPLQARSLQRAEAAHPRRPSHGGAAGPEAGTPHRHHSCAPLLAGAPLPRAILKLNFFKNRLAHSEDNWSRLRQGRAHLGISWWGLSFPSLALWVGTPAVPCS